MSGRTSITGRQVRDESLTGDDILDGSVQRKDLDVSTPGQAVVRRIIAGTNISIGSTGIDSGTGDVTINASGGAALINCAKGGTSANALANSGASCARGGDSSVI